MSKFKPDNEISNGPRRKKNRSKYCRGKVGQLHQPVWMIWQEYARIKEPPLLYKCTICNKHIDHWFSFFGNKKYKKPEIGSTEPKKLLDKRDK